jgi:2-oxoisovalerate dehydrogenase E1 component alpha subunit
MALIDASQKACGLGLPGMSADGMDFLAMYQVMKEAVARARAGEGPSIVEAKVYRITPHSSDDDDRSYRSREEVEEHKQRDPLRIARQSLTEKKILTQEVEEKLEAKAKEMVDLAVRQAESAPYPQAQEAAYPVFAEEVKNG